MIRLPYIFLILIFLPLTSYAGDTFNVKVAVVDVESILEHSFAIQNIRQSITEISDKLQKEMSEKELELKRVEEKLLKDRETLSKEAFDRKVAAFNKNVSEAQHGMKEKKIALEQAHAAAIAKVHKTTISVISKLAKKYGFNLVLPSAQVLFADNELNITLEVISNLNESLKKVDIDYNK